MSDNYVIDFFIKKGKAIGLLEGEKRGKRKGLQEGMEKGLLLEACRSVIQVLTRRFKKVPDKLLARVRAINDRKRLEELLDQAIACKNLRAFERFSKTS